MTAGPTAPILVAVDATPESLAALHWAVNHASALGCRLRVITAFGPRYRLANDSTTSYVDEMEHAALLATERARAALSAAVALDELDYDHIVALGPIQRVLSDYSHDAYLLVVGTRTARNWIQRVLQRSVTNQLTGNLACPVVIVTVDTQMVQSLKQVQSA